MYSFFFFVSVSGVIVSVGGSKERCVSLASTFTWSQECSYFRVVVPTLTDAKHGSVVCVCVCNMQNTLQSRGRQENALICSETHTEQKERCS